ncbi:Y-family DNA polymerase [Catenovulum sp. SX2]|uniref:Y-family DNA polymerase n=1 Tax=Catenovulum sp. SX2 TaxID=3398614 RepID=UPI003F82672E
MIVWLYLHFPSLQLDTLFKDSDIPLAIVHNKNHQIVQLNTISAQSGIQLGMGLGTAAALCRDLQIHPYNESTENKALIQIAEWLYLTTADIHLLKPNGLLLKVSSMLTLYENLTAYWQAIQSHLAHFSVNYDYATGYSPNAAKLLAQTGVNQITEDKQLINRALAKIPLTKTELPLKTITSLKRVGVQYINDLLKLSLADIAKRFDIELVTYIGKLSGQLKHPVDFFHPAEQFNYELELMYEIDLVDKLIKPLQKIFSLLEHFLLLRNKQTSEVNITLFLRDLAKQQIKISSAQGEYKAEKWLELTKLTFESVIINAPVISIRVAAANLFAFEIDKQDMFAGAKGEITPQALIAKLQAKLGEEQVTGIQLFDDHRPERASQYCKPFTQTDITTDIGKFRPSILLTTPTPLTDKIDIRHGPERIVSGWWDNENIIRDYFIARNNSGQWLWVYRTPQNQWFVHGLFC